MSIGTPAALNPIETPYAGCRFRSRLEARWAVYFDALNITWDYELEGFNVTWRLSLDEDTFRYLPDFWLPDLGLWVEVKGALHINESFRLLNAAASLSSPGGGCGGGNDTLMLGRIPDPRAPRLPLRLHMHKGDLIANPWPLEPSCNGPNSIALARDVGPNIYDCGPDHDQVTRILLHGYPLPLSDPWWTTHSGQDHLRGLTRARSARFEHGESG